MNTLIASILAPFVDGETELDRLHRALDECAAVLGEDTDNDN